ncbi:MAG: 30S ribosomal protein S24e [Candidatus Bathyarchaeota archaeon]|nr:30S ribosomal protein S24e [Candidatus Bathyarchaeota archaeon]
MEVKIVSVKENPLLKRKEVSFRIEQNAPTKTPVRLEVKKAVAAELKINNELVFVKKMRTLTGTNTTVGVANVYETIEQARLIEPEYILKRNSPPEQPKEAEATQ